MNLKPFLILNLIILAIALSGCATFLEDGSRLDGTGWELESIGSKIVDSERKPTLKFSDERASGSAGCNSFQGEYSTSGQEIKFADLAMTLMACPDAQGLMDLEQQYFSALQQAETYELSGDRLSIHMQDGSELVFTRQ
jgi:heat shock protein HslJ